jgi:hypothetical protein
MRVGKPVSVFAITPAPNPPGGVPGGTTSPDSVIQPLETVLPNGNVVGMSPLIAKQGLRQFSTIDWSNYPGFPASGPSWQRPIGGLGGLTKAQTPQGIPPPASPPTQAGAAKPSIVGMAPSAPAARPASSVAEDESLKERLKSGWGFLSGTTTVVKVTEGMSRSDIIHHLPGWVAPQQANSIADAAMKALHSHGAHAVFIAITGGGILAAIARLLGARPEQAATIGVIGGILLLVLFYSLMKEKSPFIGKWNLNAIETSYELGIPPRQAVEEITDDNGKLKITRTGIEEGGKRDNATLEITLDGRPHDTGQGESVTATQKDHTLQLEFSRNGQASETEVQTLSADEKKMTVTTSGRSTNGTPYKNVAVYDRE